MKASAPAHPAASASTRSQTPTCVREASSGVAGSTPNTAPSSTAKTRVSAKPAPAVTSARPLDGKTTTACNLAIQLARIDQALSVILVDLDLRRASIAAAFGLDPDVPLDAVLRGEKSLSDAIFETDLPGLSMLALKDPAPDPEWLLALASLERMIAELERRFDFVIIDSPPVLATSDAQVILRHASAGLFIARMGVSPVKAIRSALEHIPVRKLLGSVLNSSRTQQGLTDYPYLADPNLTAAAEPSNEEPGFPDAG